MNTEDIIQKINQRIYDIRSNVEETTSGAVKSASTSKSKSKSKGKDNGENEMDRIFSYFKLHEKVVAFYDGREWNVISLNFMIRHPIVIYRHWSDKDQVYYDNSLVVCPLTLRSMIYKGRIRVEAIEDRYELILKNEETGDVFPISNPYTGHYDKSGAEKKIKSQVKRNEVKILEHRDIFAFDSDPKYVTLESDVDPIIDEAYYDNKVGVYGEELTTVFHPKSLVYVVQYYSQSDNAYRHLILISSQMSKKNIVGYRYRHSRFWSYSEENKEKLIEKRAFTYPMLWHTIEKIKISNYETHVIQ
jgi:hypothetical protein